MNLFKLLAEDGGPATRVGTEIQGNSGHPKAEERVRKRFLGGVSRIAPVNNARPSKF